jgi:hypothetical protein
LISFGVWLFNFNAYVHLQAYYLPTTRPRDAARVHKYWYTVTVYTRALELPLHT